MIIRDDDIPETISESQNTDTTAPKQQIGRPFPKGVSGNPEGRPPGSKNFSTVFEEAIKLIVKEQKIPVKNPEVEMVVKAISQALKGNYMFYKDIMDRTYGATGKGLELNIDNRSITFIGSPEQNKEIDEFVISRVKQMLKDNLIRKEDICQ